MLSIYRLTCFVYRSSKATDVDNAIYGSIVPVLDGEKLSLRILVSTHSSLTYCNTQISNIYTPVILDTKMKLFLFQVDHSIIESFAQGGRSCITSRIYPTTAINQDAQIFLFNNATDTSITASLQIWQMSSASDIQLPA